MATCVICRDFNKFSTCLKTVVGLQTFCPHSVKKIIYEASFGYICGEGKQGIVVISQMRICYLDLKCRMMCHIDNMTFLFTPMLIYLCKMMCHTGQSKNDTLVLISLPIQEKSSYLVTFYGLW